MDCAVPDCKYRSYHPECPLIRLPENETLRDRWLQAIQLGTGLLVDCSSTTGMEAVCGWHFENKTPVSYQEPGLFLDRNGKRCEVCSCRICLKFYHRAEMVPTSGNLLKKPVSTLIQDVLGLKLMDKDFSKTICEECLVKLDIHMKWINDTKKAEAQFQELTRAAGSSWNQNAELQQVNNHVQPDQDFCVDEFVETIKQKDDYVAFEIELEPNAVGAEDSVAWDGKQEFQADESNFTVQQGNVGHMGTGHFFEDEVDCNSQFNPYKGIRLENTIDIDRIFEKTDAGIQVMQMLKQGLSLSEKMLRKVNNILCECLRWNYGLRPSAHHKNMMALSLVDSYPILRSSTPDVPQAFWFYPHGCGQHRHSGRLHCHMEYLVRKSSDRKFVRNKKVTTSLIEKSCNSAALQQMAKNVEQMTNELKSLRPGPDTRSRAEELWLDTFDYRDVLRKTKQFHSFLRDCPAATAFDGHLLTLDFKNMHPLARPLEEGFKSLISKILTTYPYTLMHVVNETVRALGIIRMQNPTRGTKRNRTDDETSAASVNPLAGIIEWVNFDDPLPVVFHEHPILFLKGKFPEDTTEGIISWDGVTLEMRKNLLGCFEMLCRCLAVFNAECGPGDKQFFTFTSAVFMGVGNITTTGEKFLLRLK